MKCTDVPEGRPWHRELLTQMTIPLSDIRPAVLTRGTGRHKVAYGALDELWRFRHPFRHAHSVKLDPVRLQLMMRNTLVLKAIYAD